MSDNLSWGERLACLLGGESDPRALFTEQHIQVLTRAAERHLRRQAKDGVGAADVVQSVLASFFGRLGNPDPSKPAFDFRDEGSMWNWLAKAVVRHCEKWNKRLQRHPRRGLGDAPVAGAGPAPEEEAALADFFAHLVGKLDEFQGRILQLSLEAPYTRNEMAVTLSVSPATVSRNLRAIRKFLDGEDAGPPPPGPSGEGATA